ncbi:MAG: type II toxin-antitoxin system Phd/YefM family antitoxin [Thioploca sp.]|nr:type II toxin-antitoxin system Phd/YefM family antitoxin [Thioploca sp.]
MLELHPEILSKNGKKEFAILPYEEYEQLLELLEDLEDLQELHLAKQEESNEPTIDLAEVKQLFKQNNNTD